MQAEDTTQLTDFLIDHAKDVHEYTHTVLVPQIERYLAIYTAHLPVLGALKTPGYALDKVTPWPR